MAMRAIAREAFDGLWHKGCAETVLFSNCLHHVFVKHVAVSGFQSTCRPPVLLKLAIGVFVVVLIRPPAKRLHVIANLRNEIEPAHHRLLVIAGFGPCIGLIGNRRAVQVQQKELTLAKIDASKEIAANQAEVLAQTLGNADINNLDINQVRLFLDDVLLVENGGRAERYREEEGQKVMDKDEFKLTVRLGRGSAKEQLWTSDLSHQYVTINAEYRT